MRAGRADSVRVWGAAAVPAEVPGAGGACAVPTVLRQPPLCLTHQVTSNNWSLLCAGAGDFHGIGNRCFARCRLA